MVHGRHTWTWIEERVDVIDKTRMGIESEDGSIHLNGQED